MKTFLKYKFFFRCFFQNIRLLLLSRFIKEIVTAWQKSMCLAARWLSRWQVAKPLLVRCISLYCALKLKPNGPVIKGGCVTRCKHRQDTETSARKGSWCKEGMARVFAIRAQLIWCMSDRGTNSYGTTFESGYRIWAEGTGAVSRYKPGRSHF